jgi:protein-S-isoprenylcysteine O-methyltransferase Ste14
MRLRALVGAGDRIAVLTLPCAAAGIAANILWTPVFRIGLGAAGRTVGIVCLVIGVPLWLTAVVQILVCVPRGKLITGGPFALMVHPLYTSVALLVLPGCGLLFDSWLGFAIGLILYVSVRIHAPSEERDLAARFQEDYPAYRKRVILPWL